MALADPALPRSSSSHLDVLLDEVCRALQLTNTQFKNAEEKYTAVGNWLSAPESALFYYRPRIYPQGSIALQTTCRPWSRMEYDVDLVLEVDWLGAPMDLYRIVGGRLSQHGYYKTILTGKKRCWCLNYEGAFHLDILPARPAPLPGYSTAIVVPDRKLQQWAASNPKGFAGWYHDRADTKGFMEKRAAEPLPENDPAEARPPLTRAVQLFKRHRDIRFKGSDRAPRSVVLTTLAGTWYGGEQTVYLALLNTVANIRAWIAATRGIPQVLNPTNPLENFAESWKNDPQSYEEFKAYIHELYDVLVRLPTADLNTGLKGLLERLFGGDTTQKALDGWGRRMGRARTRSELRISPTVGLTTAAVGTRSVGRNTFHGSKEE
jgi:hypothetical protein